MKRPTWKATVAVLAVSVLLGIGTAELIWSFAAPLRQRREELARVYESDFAAYRRHLGTEQILNANPDMSDPRVQAHLQKHAKFFQEHPLYLPTAKELHDINPKISRMAFLARAWGAIALCMTLGMGLAWARSRPNTPATPLGQHLAIGTPPSDLPMSAPKRRWLPFALPALFLVAVFCAWVGWNAYIVHERTAWYRRVGPSRCQLANSALDSPNIARWRVINSLTVQQGHAQPPIATSEISLVRELLNDRPFDFLTVPASEGQRVRSLFPEAYMLIVPDDQWSY